MKDSPAVPGGPLTSKPTWSNASGRSATPAFFVLVSRRGADERLFVEPLNLSEKTEGTILCRTLAGAVTVH